jgi:hypothetical protein
MLGISNDDTNFNDELIMFINGALMVMTQLGVGPSQGFSITSAKNTWKELLGDRKDLDAVRSDVFLRVRLIFDPPINSFLVTAIEKQIAEYDWRIAALTIPQPIVSPEV